MLKLSKTGSLIRGSSPASDPFVKLRQGLYDHDQSVTKPAYAAESQNTKQDTDKDPLEEMETCIDDFLSTEHVGPINIKSYLKDQMKFEETQRWATEQRQKAKVNKKLRLVKQNFSPLGYLQ